MTANAACRTPDVRVFFDGQSLNLIPTAKPYPRVLMLSRGGYQAAQNVAVSGASWTQLTNGDTGIDPASTRLHPLFDARAAKNILIMCGGTTDINDGDTAATILSEMEDYADAARTAGATHVIACTVTGSTGFTSGENTVRSTLNSSLITNANAKFDAVVDLAGTTGLDDHTNSTYYVDGTHWNFAGAQLAADTVGVALDTILAA